MADNRKRPHFRHPALRLAVCVALTGWLGACSSAEKFIDQVTGSEGDKLAGARESVLGANNASRMQVATEPEVIPAAISNQSWAQPGGVPSNVMQNLALNIDLKQLFAVSAGRGSDSDGRLTAPPIIVAGRIYVVDSEAVVRAFSADAGATLWTTSLAPQGADGEGAFGGGLASDGARIYATTAFGEALALDAASGAILWRQKFDGPIRGAPTR